jgi:hypothetical protein
MFTILNWGEKSKKVCDASISNCSNCNHLTTFELRSCEKTAGMFFISMAKWDKKYYFVCQKCSAGFPILEDKIDESLKLFTEAPSHSLSAEIYKELKDLFISGNYLGSEEKLSKYPDEAKSILKEKGYRENDVNYIIPIALKEIFRILELAKS